MYLAFRELAPRSTPSLLRKNRFIRYDEPQEDIQFGHPVLTAPCLGCHGRWGNAILQYMSFKVISESLGLPLETPLWLGRYLFQLPEPQISRRPKTVILDGVSQFMKLTPIRLWPVDLKEENAQWVFDINRIPLFLEESVDAISSQQLPFSSAELQGFFFVHAKHLVFQKELLRELLQPIPGIQQILEPGVAKLRALGKTIVGLHIRRTDFLNSYIRQGFELVIPMKKYKEWLRSLWPTLDQPVLFLATDDPQIIEELAEFSPVTARDLGIVMPDTFNHLPLGPRQVQKEASFFPDWYLLTLCDVLLISNSTFSFSSALLNQRARLFLRPTFEYTLEAFDPWASEPLLFFPSSKLLLVDLVRRAKMEIQSTSLRRAPRALREAVRAYHVALRDRLRYQNLRYGTKGVVRALFDPRLYLFLDYRVR